MWQSPKNGSENKKKGERALLLVQVSDVIELKQEVEEEVGMVCGRGLRVCVFLYKGAGLAAREAAHLAVLGARLVHEGAVQTGPHGGGGGDGRRGTANSTVTVGTGRLTSHCAAELLDCGPLLRLLPSLSQILVRRLNRIKEQINTVSQRHDFVGEEEEQQVEVRHHVQKNRGAALGQVRG